MPISAAASALTAVTKNITAPTNGLTKPKPPPNPIHDPSSQKASLSWVQKNLTEQLRGEFRQKLLEQRSLANQAAAQVTGAARADAAKGIIAAGDAAGPRTASQSELESRAKATSGQELPPPATLLDIKV